jgi:hypothetical protein
MMPFFSTEAIFLSFYLQGGKQPVTSAGPGSENRYNERHPERKTIKNTIIFAFEHFAVKHKKLLTTNSQFETEADASTIPAILSGICRAKHA